MSEIKTPQVDAGMTAGLEPKMRGDAFVGFGSQHSRYAAGRADDIALSGFFRRANGR